MSSRAASSPTARRGKRSARRLVTRSIALLKGTVKKPANPVSIEEMNRAIAKRGRSAQGNQIVACVSGDYTETTSLLAQSVR